MTKNLKIALPIALLIVLTPLSYFGYQKYLDWENRQLIVGISEDFPELIAEIQSETGAPLKISSDCILTQEKYTKGVVACGIVGYAAVEYDYTPDENYITVIEKSQNFIKGRQFESGDSGHIYTYNKIECGFNYKENARLDCPFSVRSSNKDLASELLSEDSLNARKDEILRELQSQ
ncbi:MAG: hypothetical protein ACK5L6_11660 [Anaerorhabdus sp.]|uniref:hypothetical protein n=1 Tax=Anaerorhabdus sp. TaxID=1872524 RepID=UPI003A883E0E